ncbi:hypothetical protein EV363DRAFT_1315063 [Boletus edulis]|nr:hypothetical protein EV363DRAFT_1315063 [Boletus edulis]
MNEGIRQTSASSNLYVQMNPPCSIHSLPVEVLEAIFIYCAHEYHETTIGPALTVPSWVNVSFVSRCWRTVALNYPTLWSYLFITSPRWTEELLARSKQAPLKLLVNTRFLCTNWVLRSVEQVLDHVERIQELGLYFSESFQSHHILSRLSSRAPHLQNLELLVLPTPLSSHLAADRSNPHMLEWFSLPPFGGDTPSLRTLVLSGCPVPWYLFELSGLKTLILREIIPVKFRQNTVEFLATLSCMQDLTHLHLENALASAADCLSSATFHTFQKFDLPHLSRLFIAAPLSTIVALLSRVSVPLKAEINLRCDPGEDDSEFSLDDRATLCSLLAQRFSTAQDRAPYTPTIRSLTIASYYGWERVGIAFTTSECKPRFVGEMLKFVSDGTIPLQINFNFKFRDWMTRSDRERITSNICCSLPLSNVERACFCDPPLSQTFWTDILSHLQGLRYLTLSEGHMPSISSILAVAPDDRVEEGGRRSQIFVPALEELELCGIQFSTALEKVKEEQSLHDALSTRENAPIRLTFTH